MLPGESFWIIDTSSILEVRRTIPANERTGVFDRMTQLVNADLLVYPPQVCEELKRGVNPRSPHPDLSYNWAKTNGRKATRFGFLLEEAKKVLAVVPKILDPEKTGVEEADPYLLALVIFLQGQAARVTLITEERKDRPDKISLTTACGILGLIPLPMAAFLEMQGIWPHKI